MNRHRCETCKNYHYIEGLVGWDDCDLMKQKLSSSNMEFSRAMGCASHSDFQSERDKTLDEGLLYLATGILVLMRDGIPSKKEDVIKSISELSLLAKQLRQQAGDRE
jgi:hypothetical protein